MDTDTKTEFCLEQIHILLLNHSYILSFKQIYIHSITFFIIMCIIILFVFTNKNDMHKLLALSNQFLNTLIDITAISSISVLYQNVNQKDD